MLSASFASEEYLIRIFQDKYHQSNSPDEILQEAKRPRCPNWTEQDKMTLIKSIQARRDVLMSKNKEDSSLKDAAWLEILQAVNAETHFPRTLEQVKKQHENLKMRARQVYNDMVQCKNNVNPHILSPAMKLMVDDFKRQVYAPHTMMYEDFSHSNSGIYSVKKKPTFQPILPKPPKLTPQPTATATASATSTSTISVPVTTITSLPMTVTTSLPYEDPNSLSSDWNTNSGCTSPTSVINNTESTSYSLNNTMELKAEATDYSISALTCAKRQKTVDTKTEDPFLIQHYEVERIKAETEKHRAETELIYQRRECEYALFEMKRKVLEAKLEYYRSHKNNTDTGFTSDDKS